MQTIFLEFKGESGNLRAFGTDVIFHLDGRWSASTRVMKIQDRVAQLRKDWPGKYDNVLFVGFTVWLLGADIVNPIRISQ